MDEAKCKELNRKVTSEELYIIDDVSSKNFSCETCSIELIPCAFQPNVNLVKPYFRTQKGVHHKEFCDADGKFALRKKGETSRLTDLNGFPLSYPNRFKLKSDDVSDTNDEGDSVASLNTSSRNNSDSTSGPISTKHNFETSSFQSIVNQYFDFPYDRDRELKFDGLTGSSYQEIFKKIVSTKGKQQFYIQGKIKKIYFSSLPWKISKEENNILQLELHSGRWVKVDGKNIKEKPFYLQIDFTAWPPKSKSRFLNEYKKTIELVRSTNRKAAIAFVGTQDTTGDFFRFNVEHRKLIAFKIFNDA